MPGNTIRLHRALRAAPERVYRAFLDPAAMDARVGGGHRMSFTNFTTGKSHSFGGKYCRARCRSPSA
jgi:uncharacterized protein YndB with AHSA1/START domain